MTVSVTSAFSGPYTGNGATTAFPFTFKAMAADEVQVLVDGVVQGVGFAVTLASEGGTATFTVPPADGAIIYIASDPSFAQETSFENAGAFLPKSHDDALDRAAIRDLYLKDGIERSIRAPAGESLSELPSDLAGYYLAFDAQKNPVPATGTGNDPDLRTDLAASATGASLIGWISNAVGAVARSVRDRLRDRVSVKDFGALGDGTTDDLAAFSAALASGKAIDIPEGSYALSSYPTAPTGSVRMRGAGKGKTILLINHGGARALHFTPASATNRVELSGFTMQANYASGPCPLGIEIAFPSTSSYPYRQVQIDVDFLSDLSAVAPWAKTWGRGIRLTNAWYPKLRVNGSSAPIAGDTGNTGFLEVTGGSYGCIGANIEAVWYYGADFIRGSAYMEGIYVSNSEAVGVTRGVYVPATTPNGGAAGLYRAQSIFFNNSHISSHTAGFDLDNVLDVRSIAGNIQRWADASATNWTGYKLNAVQYPQIEAGTIAGNDSSGGVTSLGISATGALSAHGIVSGVHFENLDTQFATDASTTFWTIRNNRSTGSTPDTYTLLGSKHNLAWLNNDGSITHKSDQLSGPIMTGTYTPTLTSVANVAASANYTAQYSRVGNMVRVNGRMDITATAGATLTQVGISLPVASALTAIEQCTGGGAGISTNAAVSITGDVANDRAQLNVIPAGTTLQGYTYSYQYQVL